MKLFTTHYRGGLADELFDLPRAVTIPLDRPEGDARLVGRFVLEEYLNPPPRDRTGWGPLNDDVCTTAELNVWMATIRFSDGMLLRVNAPIRYNCLVTPDFNLPYHQPDGLRAVVDAITPCAG